jgi:S-phase kinase-associated protein 1
MYITTTARCTPPSSSVEATSPHSLFQTSQLGSISTIVVAFNEVYFLCAMVEDALSDEEMVILRSKDGTEYELSADAANLSDFVKEAFSDGDGTAEVDVLRVHSDTLGEVVKFLNHYKEEAMHEIPTPLNGNSFLEIVTQGWYRDFMADKAREQIFDILTAANYMGIKPLLDLSCLKVAFELTGKSVEEIRVMLDLPVLTPEEEAAARQEHKWIFENN